MKHSMLPMAALAFTLVVLPASAQNYNYNQDDPGRPDLLAPPPHSSPAPSATDAQMRLQTMDAQLRDMRGIVERLQFRNQQLEQQLTRMSGDYDVRFQMLEKRVADQDVLIKNISVPPTPPPAAATEEPAEKKADTIDSPQPGAAKTSVPADTAKTLGTLSQSDGKDTGDAAQALYDKAFMAMRQSKYDDAERDFRDFLKANPKHRLAENAKYWLSETYYVRGKFSEAAVAFAEGYQEFPQGNKAPDNLLKMSMSLGALGKKPDACLTLGELKKRFPAASPAIRNRAEQEKKTLACP